MTPRLAAAAARAASGGSAGSDAGDGSGATDGSGGSAGAMGAGGSAGTDAMGGTSATKTRRRTVLATPRIRVSAAMPAAPTRRPPSAETSPMHWSRNCQASLRAARTPVFSTLTTTPATALDSSPSMPSGNTIGEFVLQGITAVDWEDMALGPCPAGSCLFFADIGDNNQQRANVSIARVAEPDVAVGSSVGTVNVAHDRFEYSYAPGPQNAETLLVHPQTGNLYIVTKSASGTSLVFRIDAPTSPGAPQTLQTLRDLPLTHAGWTPGNRRRHPPVRRPLPASHLRRAPRVRSGPEHGVRDRIRSHPAVGPGGHGGAGRGRDLPGRRARLRDGERRAFTAAQRGSLPIDTADSGLNSGETPPSGAPPRAT